MLGNGLTLAAVCVALVGTAAMSACGRTADHIGRADTSGDPSTGGGAGREGGSGSSGASPGGESGGALSTNDAAPTAPGLPPQPEWHPDFPLGSPGWRDNKTPFCSEIVGNSSTSVLGTPEAVYVLVDSICNVLDTRGCVPQNPVENEILYRNDGSGWRTFLRREGGNGKLVGFMDGGVVIIGGSFDCTVTHVSESGVRCLSAGVDAGAPNFNAGAVAQDGTLILLGATNYDSGKTSLVKYDGNAWSTLKTWTGEQPWNFTLSGTRIFVAGTSQFLWSGDIETGEFAPVARVPANDYTNVCALSASEFVAADSVGRLFRFDGEQWTLVGAGFSNGIQRLWGAPDGTVFAISQSQFGRYKAGALASINGSAAESPPYYYEDLSGNSANEVFLAITDNGVGTVTCGNTFLVWYDGTTFHQF